MFLRLFRLGVLALQIGEGHVLRFRSGRTTAQRQLPTCFFQTESGQGVFLRYLRLAIFSNYFQVDRFVVDDSINHPFHVIRIRALQVCDIEHLKLKDPRSGILPQSQPWLTASVAEVCHQQALAVSIEHR